MQLASFVDPDLVLFQLRSGSKKSLFEQVAKAISDKHTDLKEQAIFEGLFARERLGSTGIGEGIAVPHCRIVDAESDYCALVTLENGIAFDAPDGQPVDTLVFLVVSGEACQQHLDRLAAVSRYFSDAQNRAAIHQASDADGLRKLIFDA